MVSVDVPQGPDGQPLVPTELWATFPPAAQAIIVALAQRVGALEAEVRELKARVGQNSTNSSRPPSSDPPQVQRRPGPRPSGRRAGGQPGHPIGGRTPRRSSEQGAPITPFPGGSGLSGQ